MGNVKLHIRSNYEKRENQVLASYAQLSSMSRGRVHDEEPCPFRPCFYRDLGRIVHSTAFRLLEYKTQVFINSEGDYYRTRLTHTLEVSQISVGIARIFSCNEDLAHAIALAHDIGHSPFGHTGEATLNDLMRDDGGFEHNYQSYRIVTQLEDRHPNFKGLNLSYEILEGILQHRTDYDKPLKADDFEIIGAPTIEAQIVNRADEIAYVNHDLDDGLHWGMLTINSLKDVPLWDEIFFSVCKSIPNASIRIKRCKTISELINILIDDLQSETRKNILDMGIKTIDDVRNCSKDIVSFSDDMKKKLYDAKNFLFNNVYRYDKVVSTAEMAESIIRDLFKAYVKNPDLMPEKFRDKFRMNGSKRHICDYIAGMTDRFAISQHKKI